MRFRTITRRLTRSTLIFSFVFLCSALASIPLKADTVNITYSATGSGPAPGTTPVMTATTFSFDSVATGTL
ncbi:MAG: hypothetical protein KGM47_01685, partial [Acidobacteriota bacterium]|nr:hypothetical protein [Acidobacteriota bacterium]